MNTNQIITGDAIERLEELPANSIHAGVTSPPYFGLRDYDVEGQIGLEATLDQYIENIVAVCDELKRVLRDDGNFWLNLGDSFSGRNPVREKSDWGDIDDPDNENRRPQSAFGRKNKLLVPHRIAIALQDAGWWVRQDVVWSKPNGMPNGLTDRVTENKEYVFHLTQQPDYYFDLDSIREPYAEVSLERDKKPFNPSIAEKQPGAGNTFDKMTNDKGKNPGDVWEIPVSGYRDAHFATFPEKLVEKPIKATVPESVCKECGSPKCDCNTTQTEPGIVIDPFAGAGTTLKVAKRLDRQFLGIELNPEYADMARARIGLDVNNPETMRENDDQSGLEAYNAE